MFIILFVGILMSMSDLDVLGSAVLVVGDLFDLNTFGMYAQWLLVLLA